MLRKSADKVFVLDDESYFTLTKYQMPGNKIYYTSNQNLTQPNVKLKFKQKFEPKLMLYIVISEREISKPYLRSSKIAINKEVYINDCLKGILMPFLRKYHSDGKFLFWPDKASSHYAKDTLNFLCKNNISFIEKMDNPTNLPQCRPIEDFFGQLSSIVYKDGWTARNVEELKKRIKSSIKKIDFTTVQSNFFTIRIKLQKCADNGPYNGVH